MWDFEHPPRNAELASRYSLHYTLPSLCADELLSGRADLGLIPIASLTAELAVVPGCVIASLDRVRSIQLIVKQSHMMGTLRTVAADNASRSSRAYVDLLLRRYHNNDPVFVTAEADPVAMLHENDAALLIGDHALSALESRKTIEEAVGPCEWIDIAHEWVSLTGRPWVAAVWAVRPEAIREGRISAKQLIEDLTQSREHGLLHIEDLVQEWKKKLPLSSETIRHYLTRNIHYTLDDACLETIKLFRKQAAEAEILPELASLRMLKGSDGQ